MGEKYFDYYNSVMKEGELSEREKALIALAVAHVLKCPYCIEAYTQTSLDKGADEEQMNEAVHVGALHRPARALLASQGLSRDVRR